MKKLSPSILLAGVLICALAQSCALSPSRRAQSASVPPWKFAVFGDGRSDRDNDPGATNGVRWASTRAMAEHAASQHVSLVVFSGDLANGSPKFGTLSNQWTEWKKVMAPLYDAGIPVYVVRGNHELHGADSIPVWKSIFSYLPQNGPPDELGLTYKVETNNACFIGFDQFVHITTNAALSQPDNPARSGMVSPWVITQIKQTTKRWVFAFAHEAAFKGHHTDCLASAPAERDELWDALGAKGGVYLSGHDHMYVRHWAPDKSNHPVLELVVGDAGAPPFPLDHEAANPKPPTDLFVNAAKPTVNTNNYPMYFGYVVVTVHPDRLEGQWWALTNYDTTRLADAPPPASPKFEALDTFAWPLR
jgi:hypothetical protein